MPWKEEFATGIEQIDLQHKLLFEHTDVFREVLEAGVGEKTYWSFLEFLQTFIRIHFVYEEECMNAYRCPRAGQNKEEHVAFARFIANHVADYEQNGFDRQKAIALLAHIEEWLINHIGRVGAQLRDCAPL